MAKHTIKIDFIMKSCETEKNCATVNAIGLVNEKN